jgi:ATP-dependent helicase/nuclease subunit A
MTGRFDFGPPDQGDRIEAATNFEDNLVVIAGAGTGKTSLLIERVLTAIGADLARIEEIAAITFTEKAAGEMRQRLAEGLERLRAIARGGVERDASRAADRALDNLIERFGVEREQVAERALVALQNLDRSRVDTIHTFCSGLLREHPVEAGVDPGFDVDAGEVFETVLEETWERFLGRELGHEAVRVGLWERVLDRLSIEDTRAAAFELAGFGVPEKLLETPAAIETTREFLGDHAGGLATQARSLLETQEGLAGRGLSDLQAMIEALEALEGGDGLGEFLRIDERHGGLAERVKGRGPYKKKQFGSVDGNRIGRVATQFSRLGQQLHRVDDEASRDLIDAVRPFALEAREELLRRGYVTFDGLLVLARDLLLRSTDVRNALKKRFRMLLVDEFQDTDPVQYEIVLLLAEEHGNKAEDPYRATLEPGRLFIVGDPKQSIYRFRGADYAAFARAVHRVTEAGGKTLHLTANFRSVPEIVGPVNALFGPPRSVYWEETEYQPAYESIDAVRPPASAPRVEVWSVEIGDKPLAAERREAEGKIVAETIRQMVGKRGGVGYGSITILLRAFTHLSDYLRPLREGDIPFVVDGGREFLARPEVGHLLVMLKTLARPSDPVALVAFLRSPVGAVPDGQLAAYAAAGLRWGWSEEIDEGEFPDIARAYGLLRELHEQTRHAPADEIVRRVLDDTDLLAVSGAAFEGPQRVANLQKLGAAAAELARDGRLSLIEVIEALEEGRTSTAESDSPLADEETDAVRVMTIHKAKGLENDVVIIPDLAREDWWRAPRSAAGVARLGHGGQAAGVNVGGICNLAWARIVWEESLHDEAEETRVLYVGMTRARERLIVLAAPSRRISSWVESLLAWDYHVDHRSIEGPVLCGGTVIHHERKPKGTRRVAKRAAPAAAPEAVSAYDEAVKRLGEAGRPVRAPSDEESWRSAGDETPDGRGLRRAVAREESRAVGVVLHQLLEQWDGREDDAIRSSLPEVSRAVALETGVDFVKIEKRAGEILERFLGSDLRQELAEIEILGQEIPLQSMREKGGVYRGTIDLVYRDTDGGIVIVDYKTDAEEDEQTLRDRYARQLEIYANATRDALNLDQSPRTELWHLPTTRRVPL